MSHKMSRYFSKRNIIKLLLVIFLALMLFRPAETLAGASSGLLLWFEAVLPNLLPFIIVSGLIIRLQITRTIGNFMYPLFMHLFPVSKDGCYPIFIGFLSGIPVGAKTSADLVENKSLSLMEGQFLTSMCNNASPMFILGYICTTKLATPKLGIFLCLIIYTAAIISARVIYENVLKKKEVKEVLHTTQISFNTRSEYRSMHFKLLDEAILNGFEVVTKVGGYIILFSVLASIVESFGFLNIYITAVITSLLEITVGIHNLSTLSINLSTKIVLIATITAFGGLSGLAQTKSVMGTTGLSIKIYLLSKLLCTCITFLLSYIYVALFF